MKKCIKIDSPHYCVNIRTRHCPIQEVKKLQPCPQGLFKVFRRCAIDEVEKIKKKIFCRLSAPVTIYLFILFIYYNCYDWFYLFSFYFILFIIIIYLFFWGEYSAGTPTNIGYSMRGALIQPFACQTSAIQIEV